MGMFLNYQNIADNYTPNNLVNRFPLVKSYTKLNPVAASKPYEEYDAKGNLVGYSWYQGETLNLEFNIDGEVVVENDAIVFTAHGDIPSVYTQGHINQRAYNVVDMRSWTCAQIDVQNGVYYWQEDEEFDHDREGSTDSIYVSAKEYLSGKKLEFSVYNFRHEPIYTKLFDGTSSLVVTIDSDLSKRFLKGIYTCSLTVVDDFVRTSVFNTTDCILLVK